MIHNILCILRLVQSSYHDGIMWHLRNCSILPVQHKGYMHSVRVSFVLLLIMMMVMMMMVTMTFVLHLA